ncbi:MAG: hypothetical protein NDI69_13400 [Bacteriovoracaceae bacterium]|nr:hypothetical protein [Bacteriovoracaceae bacterium]
MKKLTTLALLTLSMSSFAFEQTAELDFSSLYGKLDAGTYKVDVKLSSKKTLSEGTIKTSIHHNDGDFTCTTAAKFEIGEMTYLVKQNGSEWKKTGTHTLFGEILHTVDGKCDLSYDNFIGNKNLYASISFKSPITLPVAAPAGYDNVEAYLTPFAGYLYLKVDVHQEGDFLVMDPSEILGEEHIYSSNESNASKFYYYVQSRKGPSSLSLGTGFVEFK